MIFFLIHHIGLVEEGYHSSNPYHNAVHAADVTQAMHCFLQEEKVIEVLSKTFQVVTFLFGLVWLQMRCHLTPLEIAASLIAAMAHDLDHPGVNQPFLVATSNHLASLYKVIYYYLFIHFKFINITIKLHSCRMLRF